MAAQLGHFKLPKVSNEPMLNFAPGSAERKALQQALADIRSSLEEHGPFQVPCVVNGLHIKTDSTQQQLVPFEHKTPLCTYHEADAATIDQAIKTALAAKPKWEAMPFNDRAAIFLKAADLLSTKYRFKVLAATMFGQGKNAWQAEIDGAAELIDFWRFNCIYAADIYAQQPSENSARTWNRVEYRGLEGFILAFSPFNFTAIGGNLASAPAIMGNVVLWKPSPMAVYSNYLVFEILREAGLPDGVIQFLPGDAAAIADQTIQHPSFAGLHFTGSTIIFKYLWQKISNHLNVYKSYPRIVGETGGKNMHFVHKSADVSSAALNSVRSAFEYAGQKCSACSRAYVPDSIWTEFSDILVSETKKFRQGPPEDFTNLVGPVINKASFDKIKKYLDGVASDSESKILVGGICDDSKGYFIQPTVIVTTNPHSATMVEELFGPVLTVYVYPADKYEETLELADSSSSYALTAALFAKDREAVIVGAEKLRHAAGNFYINDKSTGAVVGQQPFGGGRQSGTNDKAGSSLNLLRWVSARAIKETFTPLTAVGYPSNDA
ncbi:L-glutamate gamma-semialdehyde dehydrogenase [Synchytrium microbalum]|uniref:Multifunctional fusion protein n=1 Tax=Synchytrium microbalum TaxID=1806994 RepID=A0A507CA55_9FUNG|nr:L-glutamate gamma-semialdehyde dehydrogenase [Synchytrium microbalum]TPX34385.1 L-glutamate gamma-semialdehyde dehydrogenase [Synchytrium microbalum]